MRAWPDTVRRAHFTSSRLRYPGSTSRKSSQSRANIEFQDYRSRTASLDPLRGSLPTALAEGMTETSSLGSQTRHRGRWLANTENNGAKCSVQLSWKHRLQGTLYIHENRNKRSLFIVIWASVLVLLGNIGYRITKNINCNASKHEKNRGLLTLNAM